jgi:hypothetical protein
VVNDLLTTAGHPARVSCASGAWVVRSATGAATVVDTVSELWEAVRGVRDVDVPGDAGVGSPSPVMAAVLESAAATASSRRHRSGATESHREPGHGPGRKG